MTALVSATVLRWEVKGDPAAVHYVDSTPIKMVVGDGVNSADVTPVIAEYILKAKDSAEQKKWLQAARDGLLQVTEMSRVPLTKPAVPPKL